MARPINRIPSYLKHGQSGRGYVTYTDPAGLRRQHLLPGPYDSAESRQEYERIRAEVVAGRDPFAVGADAQSTVNVLLLKFLDYASRYYRGENGEESNTVRRFRECVRKVRELYGHTPAVQFGPKAMMTVMDGWVADGITRREVNARLGRVKQIFEWAVREEILPAECHQRLLAVKGLRKGRTVAPDNPPVRPAVPADVEKVVQHLRPAVGVIVRLMVQTGARCGELVKLRVGDLDRSGEVWVVTPATHKTAWKGKSRSIYFGRKSQELLAPVLLKAGGPDAYLFSPAREEAERNAERAEKRVTPRYPSHMKHNARRKAKRRRRPPGEKYVTQAVRVAIKRACEKAGVPDFTPHQLRHLAGTLVREQMGHEVARALL